MNRVDVRIQNNLRESRSPLRLRSVFRVAGLRAAIRFRSASSAGGGAVSSGVRNKPNARARVPIRLRLV